MSNELWSFKDIYNIYFEEIEVRKPVPKEVKCEVAIQRLEGVQWQ
jgi:hypothetical protein